MIPAIERNLDEAAAQQSKDNARVAKMKGRLGEHRLAGEQGAGNDRREARRPSVVLVATIEQRDQKTGVCNSNHPRE